MVGTTETVDGADQAYLAKHYDPEEVHRDALSSTLCGTLGRL
jgi:hypothetical protein